MALEKKTNLDSFANAVTSVGTSRDPGTQVYYQPTCRYGRRYLDSIYAENALFAKIIDLFPDDGTRAWIDFNHPQGERITEILEDLQAEKFINRAAKRERLHGGCVIHIDAADGQDHAMPLNMDNIQSIKGLQIYEADYIQPQSVARSGNSDTYMLNSTTPIHESRLLVFPGIEVSDDYRMELGGWGETVGRRVIPSIKRREMILANIATLSGRMVIPHWGIDGLNEMVESDDEQAIKGRMQAKLIGESTCNAVVTDVKDTFQMVSVNLAGIQQLLDPANHDLVAVSGIPHTKLLGESPGASLGANGGSQERDWHKAVSAYQEDKLRPTIQKLLDIITAFLRTEPVVFEFCPLDKPTLQELAEVHYKQAQADDIYVNKLGMPADQILQDRFMNGYSVETTYDEKAIAAERELELEIAVAAATMANDNPAADQTSPAPAA